ncbi:MAG: transcriptional regulator [Alphaproteobacteria bacterium]|nr:transcriptional regulator [Alphaproteobacteria bacterium]
MSQKSRTETAQSSAAPKTRRAILDLLKLEGPQEAAVLAARLSLSAMGVRQHLYALAEEGFVDTRAAPRPVGRPAKLWSLTESADRFFPDAHADLTADLLRTMRAAFGEDGVETLIRTRGQEQTRAYTAEMAEDATLPARLDRLAEIRSREGYMAEVRREEDGAWMLIENHCPICVAAAACSGICAGELLVFKAVLGPDVQVERTDHILAGARRCAYRISQTSAA